MKFRFSEYYQINDRLVEFIGEDEKYLYCMLKFVAGTLQKPADYQNIQKWILCEGVIKFNKSSHHYVRHIGTKKDLFIKVL